MDDVEVRRLDDDGDQQFFDANDHAPDESDFLANMGQRGSGRPRSGTFIRRMPSDYVDGDDFQSADGGSENGDVGSMDGEGSQGGGGLIEEEKSEEERPAQLPGVVVNPPAAPMPHFSREDPKRVFDPAQWRTGRADRVMGQYWRTFGERKRAVGGGVGGFFKAMFGRGMARANRKAERRLFDRAPIQAARAWREQRRDTGAEHVPARSALRTRLAGPTIRDLSTFPREPGIAYDEPAAQEAHAGFMEARQVFQATNEVDQGAGGVMFGNFTGIDETRLSREAGDRMKEAYAQYDVGVGNQQMFGLRPRNPFDAKAIGLANANRRAGEDAFAGEQRPRRTPQRVRFKDGPDDAVGQPVNDDGAGPKNKVMPTSVRFFPAPIGSRTFKRDLESRYSALKRTPEFQALSPEEREQRKESFRDDGIKGVDRYVESLGADGPEDEISDEPAMDNAQFAWPVRARMLRMGVDERMQAMGTHQVNYMNAEVRANRAGTDPLESDEFRDQYLRSQIGDEVDRDLGEKAANDAHHRARRTTDTSLLSQGLKTDIASVLQDHGMDVDPAMDLTEQVPRLPHNFYDVYFQEGRNNARAGGGGGGGLIEEEKE